ncbi:beta-lactamase family protein [Roseateles sp. DAIF2]|uniref:serine hydrolase domain-containing protein n=1 Tax=Roseateles sp. DAIF2 TaxID=2714952 RepID=UPI0018A326C8|nr:serine hydrolase domain-containing protein [Roseateles sp. DAIF2]QPF72807.1 beta-lactamase family protein [Roseateles sp. DAIF2]
MDHSLHKRIDALFADLSGRAAPGYALGVMRDGELLLAKGYGQASLEQGTPLRADSLLRIASVSKQFTVAAVALLARRGRLSLEDDIRRHLPELPELPATVRIGHLMRNSSGLPDMLELLRLGGVQLDQRIGRAQLLQAIARCRHLNFAPGSRFLYSNSGFALLGLIAERCSGQSLDALLREEFFAPLNMDATRMLVESDLPLAGLATPYLGDGRGQWRRAQHGFEHGGEGGMVSSVQDMLLWAAHLLEPAAGVANLSETLMAREPLAGGYASPYAHGLEHGELEGLATLGHGGLWPGFRTEFLLLPEAKLAIVAITNDGALNPYKRAREVARLLLDKPAPLPRPDAAAALAGLWLDAELGQLLELSPLKSSGQLMAQQWGVPFELQQQADGRWLPLRGAYEFEIAAPALDSEGRLLLDIGAGRVAHCRRMVERTPLPSGLDGVYTCPDAGLRWRIEGERLQAEGPLMKVPEPWTLLGLEGDLIELRSQGYWMQSSQLLRLTRDAGGAVTGFRLDSARIKGLRFERER